MTVFQSIIFSIIQGITEFLPISSKGHLNLAQALYGLTPSLTFDIFLNTATLISIIFFFRKEFKFFKTNLFYISVSTVPAVIATLLFKHKLTAVFANIHLLSIFFLITGFLLFITKFLKQRNEPIDLKKSVIIGLFQACAILPGISRSGSTIVAGLLMGLSPLDAFSYSFGMSVVASLGAMVFDFKDLVSLDFSNPAYYVAFITTFVIGLISIDVLKRLLISRRLWYLSFYLIAISAFTFIFVK